MDNLGSIIVAVIVRNKDVDIDLSRLYDNPELYGLKGGGGLI